ncbi:hypothetical protein FA95DRAFT_1503975 [Auriscalpium vulgare]|uniref:Uncharacterized protein n=1 Tax=Auriscalpium vulgare TaxID=40419 RepID=A0ACB8R5Z3_9AGAM|nr:hypothetical protein FA95DRAFT_1503975 [Auriscalpium vulgare]
MDPHTPMHDVYDGYGWREIRAGLERRPGGPWGVEDIDAHNTCQRFVSEECGLVVQNNMDWFQSVKNGNHSTGALYGAVLNNPRSIRYLREETFLFITFPGPDEPTLPQLNNVLKPYVKDFLKLEKGHGDVVPHAPAPKPVKATVDHHVSDIPASRKTSGLASCTSKLFMCPADETPFYMLVDPDGFDPTSA